MHLEDLLGEGGLQQDEWSLTAPRFGKEGQLQVVGWSGKSHGNKFYILKCGKCSQDSELFGEGYFKSKKNHLIRGRIPCGCSKNIQWSREQFVILCSRKAEQLGYKFVCFNGDWRGSFTKIRLLCNKHGVWESGNISNLVNMGHGCPLCKSNTISEKKSKPDQEIIHSFFSSGAFHPETKFWRSDRKKSDGFKGYWFMQCPECGEVGESISGNLQKGSRPCACSPMRQQECYINWVVDDDNNAVAVKFGIANNSKRRMKAQNSGSVYEVIQYVVYSFPNVSSCKKAEKDCKQELECGVVLKRDMKDGWTETTWLYNLDKIIEIYERNGGIEIESVD